MTKLSDLYPYTDSGLLSLRERSEIEVMFKVAQATAYTEFSYTGDDLTGVDIWESASKVTKLFTKVIAYAAGDIDTVTITDNVTGNVLTKTFAFSGGNISTITEVLS